MTAIKTAPRKFMRCDVCQGRGVLWLGGADYCDCGYCEGTGRIELEAHRMNAVARTVFMSGLRPHVELLYPRSLIGDIVIPRA